MSAIDSFEHAHVGNFFNLPIYWVLNENYTNQLSNLTDKTQDDDEVIDQYSLSIGGGSGEHPALILNNDAVVFQFLQNVDEVKEPKHGATSHEVIDYQMYQLIQKVEDKYYDKPNKYQNTHDICYWSIDQNQWPLETFININKKWGESKYQENGLSKNIIKAIALFIIKEMPLSACLKDADLIELAKMYRSHTWEKAFDKKEEAYLSLSVSTIKGNDKSGKIIKNNQTVWGYSLKDWESDNQPIIEKAQFEEKLSPKSTSKKIKL